MRLFIAIELNQKMKNALTGLQHQLQSQGVRGNFTRPENLHLTLAFIGEYRDPEPVLDALASCQFREFRLGLSGFGCFGDLYWVGLKQSDALQACVKRVRHALADSGIPFDRKKFQPHITIIRRATYVIQPTVLIPAAEMTVERISLFRSDRGKNGMIYTELGSIS